MNKSLLTLKALADDTRLRIFVSLKKRELCVCHIVEFTGLAFSTVSKHLSLLQQAGIVTGRKEGRWVYYSLDTSKKTEKERTITDAVFQRVKNDPKIKRDEQKIEKILSLSKEEQCPKN